MSQTTGDVPRISAPDLVLVSDQPRLWPAEIRASRVSLACALLVLRRGPHSRVSPPLGGALYCTGFSQEHFPVNFPVQCPCMPVHCPCIARACPCIARALPVLCPCMPVHEPSRTCMNVLRAPETYSFWNPRCVPPPPVVIMLAPLTRRHAARPLRNLGRTAALVSSTAAEHRIPAR